MAADFDVDAYLDESYARKIKGEETTPAQPAEEKADEKKSTDKKKETGDGQKHIHPSLYIHIPK